MTEGASSAVKEPPGPGIRETGGFFVTNYGNYTKIQNDIANSGGKGR